MPVSIVCTSSRAAVWVVVLQLLGVSGLMQTTLVWSQNVFSLVLLFFLTWGRSTSFACSKSILILTFDKCDLHLQTRPIYDKLFSSRLCWIIRSRKTWYRKNRSWIPLKSIFTHLFFTFYASLFQIMGQVILFLLWSFPVLWPWGLPFLITYSGIERRSIVHTMKFGLATASFKRCPLVQQTMSSLQYDKHALHCFLGSVSTSSNSSTLPTSWIIFVDVVLNGL